MEESIQDLNIYRPNQILSDKMSSDVKYQILMTCKQYFVASRICKLDGKRQCKVWLSNLRTEYEDSHACLQELRNISVHGLVGASSTFQ